MIRINQIKLPPSHTEEDLKEAVGRSLKLSKNAAFDYRVVKRSIDARHKPEVNFVYCVNVNVENEIKILKRINNHNIMSTQEKRYQFPYTFHQKMIDEKRPVIIGFGPAGMFAALFLARAGLAPVVIERGQRVEERDKSAESFWQGKALNTESNVQFGEGGAGTFSDGKLNTMVKDPTGRIKKVLETFVEFGADSSITYVNKPHIGTDVLKMIVKNMREEIIRLGGEIHFNTRLDDIHFENKQVKSIELRDLSNYVTYEMQCSNLVLAIGHSARDTFQMLHKKNIDMSAKAFAVGLRIEHPQEFINHNAYGEASFALPTADYKVAHQTENGRGVYSFCMCPGGYVVNASSEQGMIAVNGMSYSKRDGSNANSALIVTVTPDDFGNEVLAGMEFQQKLEKAAFAEGNAKIPVQLAADFKQNKISTGLGKVAPQIKGEYAFGNLRKVLPEYISASIIEGLTAFDKSIKGFDMEDAVFSGVESRTSSPVRILRDDDGESCIAGIYPCGEGAGYAGGITSAALDGLKTAEKICKKYV